ncbi:MAG TPA: heme exporter protein CcmB [Herpetosiphonaceae bacterium]
MAEEIERRVSGVESRERHALRFWRAAWAVFRKDVRSELRTRYALNALAVFALTVVLVVSFYLGPRLSPRDPVTPATSAALLWIALFFAALTGLGRAFVHEEEAQTATFLRLNAPPLAVFVGKWLLNVLLLAGLSVVVTLLLSLFMNLRIVNPAMLLLTLLLGGLGLAATITLIAAIIAKASARSALFAVLAFPVVFPMLAVAMTATEQALIGAQWSAALPQLQGLGAYAVAMSAAAVLLFPYVWEV